MQVNSQNMQLIQRNGSVIPQNDNAIQQNMQVMPQNDNAIHQNGIVIHQNMQVSQQIGNVIPQNGNVFSQNGSVFHQNDMAVDQNDGIENSEITSMDVNLNGFFPEARRENSMPANHPQSQNGVPSTPNGKDSCVTTRVQIHQSGFEKDENMPVIAQNCTVIHHNGNCSTESIGAESNNPQNGFHTEPNGNSPALCTRSKLNGNFEQVQFTSGEEDVALILDNSSET